MNGLATIFKALVAGLAIFRLARLIGNDEGFRRPSGLVGSKPEDFLSVRLIEFFACGLAWAGVWMSAQTTVWVVYGLGGLLLNWLMMLGFLPAARRIAARASTDRSLSASLSDVAVARKCL